MRADVVVNLHERVISVIVEEVRWFGRHHDSMNRLPFKFVSVPLFHIVVQPVAASSVGILIVVPPITQPVIDATAVAD